MTDDASRLSAVEAARQIKAGALTATALTEACLARIDEQDETVQAWQYLDRDYALSQAEAADLALAKGDVVGPLHGVPVGIKDIIDTADMPTENGSALFPDRQPEEDATAVAALRTAGAIILGKTVTTELANLCPSKTRNPVNPEHTPGGSSAGSAAGVADFQVPLALGTQTGGSVIRPASFNGIYGLKPTLGLIPRGGVLLQSHTLDTLGVYGRCLEDLAIATDPLSIPEPGDAASYGGSRPRLSGVLEAMDDRPLRLAFLRTPAWDEATPGAQSAIEGLARELGAQCEEVEIDAPFDRICEHHATVMAAENLHFYGPWTEQFPDRMSDIIKQRINKARGMPVEDYVAALRDRDVIYGLVNDVLDTRDAILCLSAPGAAPHGFKTTGNAIFNGLWTYLGVPCISLPILTDEGLPLGAQLVGRRGGEAALLQAARRLERAIGI